MSEQNERAKSHSEQGLLEHKIIDYLRELPKGETVNQRQLALKLGQRTNTIHYAVSRLVQQGYVEHAVVPGRSKPIRLRSNRMHGAGMAVVADMLRLTLLDVRGEIVTEQAIPLPRQGGCQIGEFIIAVAQLLYLGLSNAGLSKEDVSFLCIAIPGKVDEFSGVVIDSPILKMRNTPLAAALRHHLGYPTIVQPTTSLSEAICESIAGNARNVPTMVYFRVGDGISAHLVHRCLPYTGAFGYAGSFGHVPIAQHNAENACAVCGSNRCLESHASGPAIASQFARILPPSEEKPANPNELIATLLKHADHGNRDALDIVARSIDLWTTALHMALNAYDPAVLILGGWVLRNHPKLAHMLARGVQTPLLHSPRRPIQILPAAVQPGRHDLAAACRALHASSQKLPNRQQMQ